MEWEQARKALVGINLACGVAFLLAPKLSMRLYGVDAERNPQAAYPIRYVGARSLVLAALLADADGAAALRKQMVTVAGVDAVANALAVARGDVPARPLLLGALTSATAAALGLTAK